MSTGRSDGAKLRGKMRQAILRWRRDQVLRWLVIGGLLCSLFTLTLMLQLFD